MNVLLLSPWFPCPPDNGAKIRLLNLLKALHTRHRVVLVAASQAAGSETDDARSLSALCASVTVVRWTPQPPRGLCRIASFAAARPEWVLFEPSPAFEHAIEVAFAGDHFDLVIAFQPSTAVYVKRWGVPTVLEELELGALHSMMAPGRPLLRRARGAVYWWKYRRCAARLLARFDAVTVASHQECRLLEAAARYKGRVEVIPNAIDSVAYQDVQAEPRSDTLIFSGNLTFDANYEAIVYFLSQIYPSIRAKIPDIRLRITGRHDGRALPIMPGDPSVVLTGRLPDVRPAIAESWVSIVPLLTGGGTRLKILEAMALGTPAVATSKGAEGLDLVPGQHLLIADRAADFAAAVVALCRDHDLRFRMAANARELVMTKYDWGGVQGRFLDLVEQVAAGEVPQERLQ